MEGKGKRRFVDSCDLADTLSTMKKLSRRSRGSRETLALTRVIEMLEIIREDVAKGRECIIEAGEKT